MKDIQSVSKGKRESESHSVVSNYTTRDHVTPWTMQSSPWNSPGQNSGGGFPPPGNLPNPGIEPRSPAFEADSLPAEPPGKPKGKREEAAARGT